MMILDNQLNSDIFLYEVIRLTPNPYFGALPPLPGISWNICTFPAHSVSLKMYFYYHSR